jgi:hypothetical protein
LAKKGVLINDPLVGKMNETQWLFELESLRLSEEDRVKEMKEVLDVVQAALVNMLGLGLMPFKEEDGTLRQPTRDEFVPLSLLVGRDEWLKELGEKMQEFMEQEQVAGDLEAPPAGTVTSLEELEALEARQKEIEMGSDIEFPDDPDDLQKFVQWNSPENKFIRENLVLPLETEEASQAPEEADPSLGQEAAVVTPEVSAERPSGRRMTVDDA